MEDDWNSEQLVIEACNVTINPRDYERDESWSNRESPLPDWNAPELDTYIRVWEHHHISIFVHEIHVFLVEVFCDVGEIHVNQIMFSMFS